MAGHPSRPWCGAHREQLWQIIDAGLSGVEPGDLISKSHAIDLRRMGYIVRGPRGRDYSTPKGEAALRNGLLRNAEPQVGVAG